MRSDMLGAAAAAAALSMTFALAPALPAEAGNSFQDRFAAAFEAERGADRGGPKAVLHPAAASENGPPMGRRELLRQQVTLTGSDDFACLQEAIYHEARGEELAGQFAVAEVILNRVDAANFPGSVCGVVNQGARGSGGCQFSYACNGRSRSMPERAARDLAARIAQVMLTGAPRRLTDGATHFHARHVNPRWARSYERTAQIGAHLFYRQSVQVTSN